MHRERKMEIVGLIVIVRRGDENRGFGSHCKRRWMFERCLAVGGGEEEKKKE